MSQYYLFMRLPMPFKGSLECWRTLLDLLRSVPQSRASQTVNVHAHHLGSLVKMQALIQQFWRWGPRCCISNLLPGDTRAAGPWTTLGVARFEIPKPSTAQLHLHHFFNKLSEAEGLRFERVI